MATPIPKNQARSTLPAIALATHGTIVHRAESSRETFVGITTDSRAVTPGSVFVALRGESHDGHAFVGTAIANGASVVVVEKGRGIDVPAEASIVEVADTLVAWGDLARAHLVAWRTEAVDGRIVAITGSAGKTTTKELTAALLAEIAPTHFTAGNLNNRIGVPAVVFALEKAHRFCVLEMGMSLRGELDAIVGFAPPDVSVVVNVGVAHAEGVGGREGVMYEKGAVFRALGPDGIAVANADDPFVMRAAEATRARRTETFGHGGAHYALVERTACAGGSNVVLSAAGRRLAFFCPLPGEAAAIDLCAALAAQEAASRELLSTAQIERALGRIRLEGRGTIRVLANDVLLLDDTYNANPASMRVALATLAELGALPDGTTRRRVAVLGEMKELGAFAEEEHVALGDAIADAGVALVIGCGGLVDLALARAAARGVETVSAATTALAAEEARARITVGDVVLVKGSRGVGAEAVVAKIS